MQDLSGGDADFLSGNGLDPRRKAPIVVEPKVELFTALEKYRDAVVGLEQSRDGAHEVSASLFNFSGRRAVFAKLAHLDIDRVERALDILRINPSPDHERPFADG